MPVVLFYKLFCILITARSDFKHSSINLRRFRQWHPMGDCQDILVIISGIEVDEHTGFLHARVDILCNHAILSQTERAWCRQDKNICAVFRHPLLHADPLLDLRIKVFYQGDGVTADMHNAEKIIFIRAISMMTVALICSARFQTLLDLFRSFHRLHLHPSSRRSIHNVYGRRNLTT